MKRRTFTPIELLIVVAIIGILAAIAVRNFMNVHMCANVSCAVSDMKTLETALESYRLDCNDYPLWTKNRVQEIDGAHPNEIRYYRMTTPIVYIASVPADPFATEANRSDFMQLGWAYDYVNTGGWGVCVAHQRLGTG